MILNKGYLSIFLKLRKANRKMLVLSWKLVKYNKGNVSSSVKPKLNTLIRGNNQTIFRNRAQNLLIGKNKNMRPKIFGTQTIKYKVKK